MDSWKSPGKQGADDGSLLIKVWPIN